MNNFKILDSVNEIIYIIDIDTNEVVYTNKKAREVLGDKFKDEKKLKTCHCVLDNGMKFDSCSNQKLLEIESNTYFKDNSSSKRHYKLNDNIFNIGDKKYRVVLAIDVSKMKENVIKINESLETEKTLEECIKKLSPIGDFEDPVNSVLDTILNYYNGDRTYIFDFDWEKNICHNTFECCREGVKSQIDMLQNIPMNIIGKWIELFEKQSIVVIEDINKIANDEKRKEEYEILMMADVTNLIVMPIIYNENIQGFLGVDNPKNNKSKTEFLEHLVFFIANKIQKNKLTTTLQSLSYKDILTGLCNRNAYNEKLKEINKSEYKSKGILFVDMNGLKYINDTFGHKHGDGAIKHLASVLKKHFKTEQIFRISGDEFVIFCKDISYKEFKYKSQNLRKELLIEEKGLASIGYIWDDSDTEIEILEQQAEQLMYSHKQIYYINNENRTKRKRPVYERPAYVDEIVDMLDKGEFLVYLQPIYHTKLKSIYGAEALVRRKDEEGNIINPFEFIHIFEKENLISHIDFFVFEQVCKILVRWEKQGYPKYTISNNFSRITVAEEGFVERVFEICDRTGVDCSQLVFEITESSNVIQMEKLSDIMNTLKFRGIKFALDDMGTEYSTLEMLAIKEFDKIKFDRSLIMRLKNGSRDQYIIESLIELCHKLNMTCIAEGVETEEQHQLLTNMQCDKIQGYLIGRPMPVEQFEKHVMK
ncbi:sensor domain-containing phosphodiesterase [Terrisporobacter sp.]